jgi:hypothetical protein
VLLPCASANGIGISPATLACLANGAVNGFGNLDEQPGYGDADQEEHHIPNNGDPNIPDPVPH